MIEFNSIPETDFGLSVKNIKKTVLPPIENRFVRKTAADGSFDFGSYFGNRIIEITFQDKTSSTKTELYNNMLNIAAWLYPLDKESKKLQILGGAFSCGEDDLFYMAKVDGSTDLEEILEYGIFTAVFVAADPLKKAPEEDQAAIILFSRNTIAYDATAQVAANIPRYYAVGAGYGIMIEDAVTNFAYNTLFGTPSAGIPSQYSAKVLSATGTHTTTSGVYHATMLTSSAAGAYFGIIETAGSQHTIPLTTDIISAGIYAKVGSGTILARLRLDYLDTAFNPLPSLFITTGSTSYIRIVLENQNQPTQKVVGLGCEAYAPSAGNVGIADFYYPMMEYNTFAHTFQDHTVARLIEKSFINLDDAVIPKNPYVIAVTLYPNWDKTSKQGDSIRNVLIFNKDSSNNIRIFWQASTEQWVFANNIGGSFLYAYAPATAHNAGDQIKLYVIREATQFKMYLKVGAAATVDSGWTADSRDNADYNILWVGSNLGTIQYINAVVQDLYFNDQDPSPNPANYGM